MEKGYFKDKKLSEAFPILYVRIRNYLEKHSYGVEEKELVEGINIDSPMESIREILNGASWITKSDELYYLNWNAPKIVNTHEENINKTNEVELGEVSYSKSYGINPDDYKTISVQGLEISTRLRHALQRLGCRTIADFLELSEKDLSGLSGIGRNTIREAAELVSTFGTKPEAHINTDVTAEIDYKATVFADRFRVETLLLENESLSNLQASVRLLNLLSRIGCKSIADFLLLSEKDIEGQRGAGKNTIGEAVELAQKLGDRFPKTDGHSPIEVLIDRIPLEYLDLNAKPFIVAFSTNEDARDNLSDYLQSEEDKLGTMVQALQVDPEKIRDRNTIVSFLKWCSFDIQSDLKDLQKCVFKDDRQKEIVRLRAERKTLEDLGTRFGVTRERIRQIEAKAHRAFDRYIHSRQIINKIYALRKGDDVLTIPELEEYFGTDTGWITYLMSATESSSFYYDSDLEVFIVGNPSKAERVREYLDTLPDQIDDQRMDKYLEDAELSGLNVELLDKGIREQFSHTGKYYHRRKLRVSDMCTSVLEKYYPDGLHIYDHDVLEEFRNKVCNEYGEVELPETDHALGAIISRVCVLCGRGRYKLRQKHYISDNLERDIYDFIEDSEANIILVNTILYQFQERLESEGVYNKYYLQGILRSLFDDKYIIKRDYLSKSSEDTSLYKNVVEFVRKAKLPVFRNDIQKAYPGITDIVINLALSDHEVINLFGKYIHASNLRISDTEKDSINSIIKERIAKDGYAHSRDLYAIMSVKHRDLLMSNGIWNHTGLYAVLNYLFENKYSFERPYISKKGIAVGSAEERIQEYVYSSDIVSIIDVVEFAREMHAGPNNIMDFIHEFKGYYLVNREYIATKEYIGLDDEIIERVVEDLLGEVNKVTPIRELKAVSHFPKLNIVWNEWLIYSIIRKETDKLSVGMSSINFRNSIPLIGAPGEIGNGTFKVDPNSVKQGGDFVLDDLDNIDDLIADYIVDEIDL